MPRGVPVVPWHALITLMHPLATLQSWRGLCAKPTATATRRPRAAKPTRPGCTSWRACAQGGGYRARVGGVDAASDEPEAAARGA